MNLTDGQLNKLLTEAVASGDDEALNRYGDEADRRREHREARLGAAEALAYAAAWYAGNGIPVFPLEPRDKRPYPRSRGFKDATTDPDQVRRWWTERPDSNIGVPTGVLFDVIDIDGEQGAYSYRQLLASNALPTVYAWAVTGRPCSRHLYIRPTGDGNAAAVWPGIDYRGKGGYVVVPPSMSATGRRYAWVIPLDLTALKAAA